MDPLHGLILGIVQGLTEPLPVSSSGHLVLVPWLLGWPEHSLTFDVALHMGTLAALLLFFWRDWWTLARAWLPGAAAMATERRLGIGLVAGTLPAAIAGLLFDDIIEQSLRSPVLIAAVLAVASVVFFVVDRASRRALPIEQVTLGRALAIGFAQALALAPGVSRSGITITAGLALGLTREAAARYAFLLAMPVTAGAGVFKLRDLVETGIPADEQLAFALGIAASFAVGLVSIRFLLQYLRRYALTAFIVYRLLLAALVLGLSALRA